MGTRANIETGGGGGSNIGNSDLTISATGVRKLIFGGTSGSDRFVLRNSADTEDLLWQGGDGSFAIGKGALNNGGNTNYNVVIGNSADNRFQPNTTIVGHQAFSTAIGGTAIGKDAQVLSSYGTSVGNLAFSGLNAVAIGNQANASVGQYNVAIGENASCSGFFSTAVGRNATAGDRGITLGGGTSLTQGVAIGGNNIGNYGVAVGYASSSNNASVSVGNGATSSGLNTAIGYGMQTSGIYSSVIGACAYGQTRVNSVAETFNWFTNDTDPIVRFGKTADQWNMGTGSFGFGTMTPDGSSVIDLSSTTKGLLIPRMTTAQRNSIGAPAESLLLYDTDLDRHHTYDGTNWKPIGSLFGFYAQTVVSATITNTTTETSIVGTGVGALSVPADTFLVGDSYHAKIGGVISAQNGDTIELKIKTGATVLATTGSISLEAVTSLGWEMELDFTIATIGAVGSICTNGNFAYNRNTGSLEGFVFQDVQSIDTTVLNTLDITVTWGQAKTQDEIYSANFVLNKMY